MWSGQGDAVANPRDGCFLAHVGALEFAVARGLRLAARVAAAENQRALPGCGVVCNKKTDVFDHDLENALDLGKSGKYIRKLLQLLIL